MRSHIPLIWSVLVSLLGVFSTGAGDPPGILQRTVDRVDVQSPDTTNMLARVKLLSSPEFAGRGNGTGPAQVAADTIAHWFAAAGLEPGSSGSWYQDFTLKGEGLAGLPARNVVGIRMGQSILAGRYIVIGAHYDHLGCQVDALQAEREPPAAGEYYPGADDNASGVAVLVELARLTAQLSEPEHTPPVSSSALRSCIFVAFVGEEVGLQGSAYFVKNLPVPRDSIDVMINLDSVGRLREGRLYVAGVGTSENLPALVEAANYGGLNLEVSLGGWDASDHVSFNTIEVPVIFLFTGPHADYHRPTDSWHTVRATGMGQVATYTLHLLDNLRTHSGTLPYQVVTKMSSERPEAGPTSQRKAWLGTIPDFTEEITGVKLAGVMDGSPAAGAGLTKGDIIVGLGGEAVADLAGLAQLLRAFRPGEKVVVVVLREGNRLEFEVTLAQRSHR